MQSIVRTDSFEEVVIAVATGPLRRDGILGADFHRVIGDLVLGVPVLGAELDRFGIDAFGLAGGGGALLPARDDGQLALPLG